MTTLTAATLPEENAYPRLYLALSGLLEAICNAPSARGWAAAMVRYELLLLAELGFGLDLASCAATGETEDLIYVSPRSARAVSRAAGEGYKAQLLPLPRFLLLDDRPGWEDIVGGFTLTGHFLERQLFAERRVDVMTGRRQMIARLQRMLD